MVKKEDAATSNGMNDDYTTNIHSSSGSDKNRNGDGNGNLNQISHVWGTWEELLLTCAVKRHGSKDWDSVAKEVVSRSSLNASAPSCRLKYQDLKRRFQDSVDDDDDGRGNNGAVAEDIDGEIPWLEQLRSLRVAELRRDVQRCDESILSLQLKVKKLEEEEKDGDGKPDLEDDSKTVRSLPSMNESNSTASADHERLVGDKTVENSSNPHPDHTAAAAVEEEEEGTVSRRSGMSHSGELGESGTSTVNRKRKGNIYGGSGGNIKPDGNQSQPLMMEIVKLIRSHPRGSVFETLLKSQETNDYKRVIRQHMDIKTIEKKMEKGSYVSSSLSFYRDLKLLFTNAIVFFPTSSAESVAAHELRTLVSNEMKKTTGISSHRVIKSEGGSLISKQKSSAPPLVACKKKSSVSEKTLPSSSSFKQKDEKKVSEVKDVTRTTTRSSRITSKGVEVVAKDTKMGRAKNNNKKQTDSSEDDADEKEETPKIEKKRASEKKKSVAEFLKRIKSNSPQKGKETTSKDQKKSDGNVKNSKAKPRELRSNSTGKKKAGAENNGNKSSSKRKQSKKEAEEVTAVATRKRGRESGKDNQQPKKRSRG
ncbi:DNA-binding bromodomain-containing protein [Raphanus sativus]|uniref:Uncharacterized protein LOC108832325 n=1 Tax=Raphanus sativus TaxID=3726 RepID=A0A6J0LNG1_RAPSA|nr:uncharacterized protein LOC108832325 [Raphanus sativus]KAJ4905004.1 DNA-binding bromodomain-containing protein [Raphanus sativus]